MRQPPEVSDLGDDNSGHDDDEIHLLNGNRLLHPRIGKHFFLIPVASGGVSLKTEFHSVLKNFKALSRASA